MRILKQVDLGPKRYIEASGSSDEDKILTNDIADGSITIESDTGDIYFYNEQQQEWIKQFSFQDE